MCLDPVGFIMFMPLAGWPNCMFACSLPLILRYFKQPKPSPGNGIHHSLIGASDLGLAYSMRAGRVLTPIP